jgi:ribosomal protein S18 acetylase RimI-like enzyme
MERVFDGSSLKVDSKVNVEIKFVNPTECKKIVYDNHWQNNFGNISDILQDSDLCTIAEIDGSLAYWSQIAFKATYVEGIDKKIIVPPESAYIYGVYTAKNFRKLRVASKALNDTAIYLFERGIKKLFLFTNTHNLPMQRTAKTAGFNIIGKITLIKIGKFHIYRNKDVALFTY